MLTYDLQHSAQLRASPVNLGRWPLEGPIDRYETVLNTLGHCWEQFGSCGLEGD